MLDGLDDVDWAALSHAYGSAATVPDGLRKLAAGDVDVVGWLEMSINHQGSVYDSTAPAVPFLVEILEEATDLALIMEVLGLLRSIGMARPPTPAHIELRRRAHRSADPGRNESALDELQRVWELNAYAVQDALSACSEQLLDLYLRLSAAEAQMAVTLVIARCHRGARSVVPRVGALIDREDDPDLRASLWAAHAEVIEGLEGAARADAIDALAQAANDDPDPLVRVICLQGYARHRIDAGEVRDVEVFTDDLAMTVGRWEASPWSHEEDWNDRSALAGDRRAQSNVLRRLMDAGESRSIIDALHHHCTWRDVGDDLVAGVASFCQDDGSHARLDRWRAATFLGSWGAGARSVADALVPMCCAEENVAAAALRSLCRLEDPRAARLFIDAVDNRALESVRSALPALALDDELLDLVALLVDGRAELDPGDEPFRIDTTSDLALRALGRAGPRSARHVDLIASRLFSDRVEHVRAAIEALGSIGETARPAVHELHRWFRDPFDRDVAMDDRFPLLLAGIAVRSWLQIGGDASVVTPNVIDALIADRHFAVFDILGALGSSALPYVPYVVSRLDDFPHPDGALARWRITGDPGPAYETLLEAARRPALQRRSVEVIERIASAAGHAPPEVTALLEQIIGLARRPNAPERFSEKSNVVWDDEAVLLLARRMVA